MSKVPIHHSVYDALVDDFSVLAGVVVMLHEPAVRGRFYRSDVSDLDVARRFRALWAIVVGKGVGVVDRKG
jgi:hypothetical protein